MTRKYQARITTHIASGQTINFITFVPCTCKVNVDGHPKPAELSAQTRDCSPAIPENLRPSSQPPVPRPHPSPPHRQSAPGTSHNVSRSIPPSAAALDFRRPPRGHPQCLVHVRSCRRCQGEGFRDLVQGIRGPHPRHLVRKRCGEQGRQRRHERCEQGWRPDREADQRSARSVRESRVVARAEGDVGYENAVFTCPRTMEMFNGTNRSSHGLASAMQVARGGQKLRVLLNASQCLRSTIIQNSMLT